VPQRQPSEHSTLLLLLNGKELGSLHVTNVKCIGLIPRGACDVRLLGEFTQMSRYLITGDGAEEGVFDYSPPPKSTSEQLILSCWSSHARQQRRGAICLWVVGVGDGDENDENRQKHSHKDASEEDPAQLAPLDAAAARMERLRGRGTRIDWGGQLIFIVFVKLTEHPISLVSASHRRQDIATRVILRVLLLPHVHIAAPVFLIICQAHLTFTVPLC